MNSGLDKFGTDSVDPAVSIVELEPAGISGDGDEKCFRDFWSNWQFGEFEKIINHKSGRGGAVLSIKFDVAEAVGVKMVVDYENGVSTALR